MNIYIDESGSINNQSQNHKHFVIAMIRVLDKDGLNKSYKRFVSSNHHALLDLDKEKVDPRTGKILKPGNKMFHDGKFQELKGAHFDREMKMKFLEFFSRKPNFEIYYIKINNDRLTDAFCQNTARVFNYTVRLAIEYYIDNGYLPDENCHIQLDERNEKTESRCFLRDYLNTELKMSGKIKSTFDVTYFDSSNNKFIQIADVFSNLYFSELLTSKYTSELNDLKKSGILKHIFQFPK